MRTTHDFFEAAKAKSHSMDPTVIEYAVHSMFKGKSIGVAAKQTARKLSGGTNLFIGGNREEVSIDPKALEDALWSRLADFAIDRMKHYKDEKRHWTLDATAQHFKQKNKKFRSTLKKRVIAKLGKDPFQYDTEQG